jgi:hypothetical protein
MRLCRGQDVMGNSQVQSPPSRQLASSAVLFPLGVSCAFVFLTFLLWPGQAHSQAQAADKESYHRAVDYCRGPVARPMALSADQAILCLDGRIDKDADRALVTSLKEGGIFVVRSSGGDIASAIALANALHDRHAEVVVYDECLSSCANYLLIASDEAYVLKGALVAWDYESIDPAFPSCSRFTLGKMRDGEFRLQRGSCRPLPADETEWRTVLSAQVEFYKKRMVDPLFEPPPDNRYVRKVAKRLFADSAASHYIGWTLHPRYFPQLFRTRISYEAYPENQAEIDEMVDRLHLDMTVVYDP